MKESRRTTADVSVENQGSVVVLQPLTKKAKLWIDENVSSEPWQWVGNGLVIDWRMAEELIDAMQEEGLILRRN
jgi:virulence-associated protein VagC